MDDELILFDRINVIKDVFKKYGEENFMYLLAEERTAQRFIIY